MYKVYLDGKPLHDPILPKEYVCDSAELNEAVNTQGSFDFEVPPTHSLWNSIKPRSSKIKITNNGKTIWTGRVISVERGWKNVKKCHAESELAFLRDIIIQPFAFKGSPRELLEFLLADYNEYAPAGTTFTVDRVTVVDPNSTIVRSSEYAMTAWDAIVDKTIDSSLGGYLVQNGRKISWLADFTDTNGHRIVSNQPVKFSQNLIDLAIETNAEDVITCLIPYGAQFEESAGTPPYEPEPSPSGQAGDKYVRWNGNRLTIASVMPNGEKVLEHAQAVSKWGRIYGTEVWDDITIASNLKTAAQRWLNDEYARALTSIEITAADLALLDSQMDEIHPGIYIPVESKPHELNELLLCTQKTTDIIRPSQTTITLGVGSKPISSMIGGV